MSSKRPNENVDFDPFTAPTAEANGHSFLPLLPRPRWPLAVAIGVAALLFGIMIGSVLGAESITGKARIVDGDTLDVGTARVRLYGIDAPEAGQRCNMAKGETWRCGRRAIRVLAELTDGKELRCDVKGRDDYGRAIAVCFAGEVEINARMVELGMAWAFLKYATDYVPNEAAPKAAKVGIWRYPTVTAWELREKRWMESKQEAPEGCPIKGNITRSGERVYHVPWSPKYARTKITLSEGERWFCTEAEALAAGWRAPYWK